MVASSSIDSSPSVSGTSVNPRTRPKGLNTALLNLKPPLAQQPIIQKTTPLQQRHTPSELTTPKSTYNTPQIPPFSKTGKRFYREIVKKDCKKKNNLL